MSTDKKVEVKVVSVNGHPLSHPIVLTVEVKPR